MSLFHRVDEKRAGLTQATERRLTRGQSAVVIAGLSAVMGRCGRYHLSHSRLAVAKVLSEEAAPPKSAGQGVGHHR